MSAVALLERKADLPTPTSTKPCRTSADVVRTSRIRAAIHLAAGFSVSRGKKSSGAPDEPNLNNLSRRTFMVIAAGGGGLRLGSRALGNRRGTPGGGRPRSRRACMGPHRPTTRGDDSHTPKSGRARRRLWRSSWWKSSSATGTRSRPNIRRPAKIFHAIACGAICRPAAAVAFARRMSMCARVAPLPAALPVGGGGRALEDVPVTELAVVEGCRHAYAKQTHHDLRQAGRGGGAELRPPCRRRSSSRIRRIGRLPANP